MPNKYEKLKEIISDALINDLPEQAVDVNEALRRYENLSPPCLRRRRGANII